MQNADSSSLFDDLDAALQSGSSEKCVAMLRQVTDLFLNEGTVVALALLSSAPLEIVKPPMNSPMDNRLLIPCKVADCKWETVSAILASKLPPGSDPKPGHEAPRIDFSRLSKSNAQRLLRFWQVREVSARSA